MAERSGFFPYAEGDSNSEYNSDWLAKYIASFIGNGTYDGELGITADGSAMAVTLPSGRAWINGYHYRNDGDMTLTIDNADGVLHRKDTVVLRWDVNARSITAQVLTGTFSSSPIAPQITRSAEQYDLKLAEISIPAGATAITQSLITDTRLDNDVCGIVTGVVNQVDTTTLYQQVQADLQHFRTVNEADFSAWFDGIKGILGTDEAGNLLAKINDLAGDGRTTETVKGNADAFAAHVAAVNPHGVTAAQVGAAVGNGYLGDVDLNTVTQSGMYRFNVPTNGPAGVAYSQLLVIHGALDTITQIVGDYSTGILYTRSGDPTNVGGIGSWRPWHKPQASTSDYASDAIALTTAGLRNAIIIPESTTIPTGLADGTIVVRYTP